MSDSADRSKLDSFNTSDTWNDPLRNESDDDLASSIAMEETFFFTGQQALKRAGLNVIWMPTVLAALLAALALVMSIAFTLAGFWPNMPVVLRIAFLPAMIFGLGWAMGFVIAVPMVLIVVLGTKHRRIWVEGGILFHKTGLNTRKLPLDKCCWMITDRASDLGGRYFGWGPLVQVQADQQVVVLGFTDANRERWAATLTQLGVHQVVPTGRRTAWLYGSVVTLTAMTLGAAMGAILAAVTHQRLWLVSGALIGTADGAALSMGVFYWARRGSKLTDAFRPTWCALAFAVVATQCAIGFEGRIVAALVNAGLGWLCGWYVTEKAKTTAQ